MPKYRVVLLVWGVLSLACCADVHATISGDSTGSFVTLHAGGALSEFSRVTGFSSERFDTNAMRTWRAGITVGAIDKRFYQMRFEVGYVGKGAKEKFAYSNSVLESDIRLHYLQAAFLPAIGKIGFRKAGLFLGGGGYVGTLLFQKVRFTAPAGGRADFQLKDEFFRDVDYGLVVSAGLYYKHHLLEIRLENGLAPLYTHIQPYKVTNRSLNLIVHF